MSSSERAISWKAPANIALVKYWGKKGVQLPSNPSLSLTLNSCYTKTEIVPGGTGIRLYFEGKRKDEFLPRIELFFSRLFLYYPQMAKTGFEIRSYNSFPHSTGMASSASFFASLALCLLSYLRQGKVGGDFFREASFLARLGSGSAARGLFPFAAIWGKTELIESSDDYAVPFPLAKVFKHYQNSIVIVDRETKEISSSEGHASMEGHPYGGVRYKEARKNLAQLIATMNQGDLLNFCTIVEHEALELQAMMMSARKDFILMSPETLAIIKKVRAFRRSKGIPVCFTLDAGPSVHILYPEDCRREVGHFIDSEIKASVIHDAVGMGPVQNETPLSI